MTENALPEGLTVPNTIARPLPECSSNMHCAAGQVQVYGEH